MHRHRKEIIMTHEAREILAIIEAPVLGASGIQISCVAHGLSDGDLIAVQGTVRHDGTGATVSSAAANSFEVDIAYDTSGETIGMWVKAKDGSGTLSSGWFDAEQYDQAVLYTVVSAYTGGTLTPTVYASPDDGATAISIGLAGAGLTSATNELVQEVGPIGKLVSVAVVLAGTEEMSFKTYLELARTGG